LERQAISGLYFNVIDDGWDRDCVDGPTARKLFFEYRRLCPSPSGDALRVMRFNAARQRTLAIKVGYLPASLTKAIQYA
jgi:hypothetical protein